MPRDFEIIARDRFLGEKTKIAVRLRELADEIDRISPIRHTGENRQPTDIVREVTHSLLWGFANLRVDMLASWATDVYAAQADKTNEHCPATSGELDCVLNEGHLQSGGELGVHATADGMFW